MADEIEIVDYDAGWPGLFAAELACLEQALPADQFLAIAHAGSTAIPGLAAKPIIDIFIAVASIETARTRLVEPIRGLGYVYWEENPDPERMFFVKGMPPFGARRTHHVHVMQTSCSGWERSLLFRDHLRAHPHAAHSYLALKRDLALRHGDDREAYTRGKDTFIASVVALVRADRQKTANPEEIP